MSSRLPVLFQATLAATLLLVAASARAQDASAEVVIPQENVRYDYAQVLSVDPVYQVLKTSRMEQVCDLVKKPETGNRLSRVVGAVKDRLGGSSDDDEYENCRMQPVIREFRRPIAYDVDYVYKGSKFRTRMARDPGNRLRVRVSITPEPSQGR